ncbi:MAG: aldehyde ferredoxin oxidoreductase N-terminal domain-containing protein, partial [Thermodesulfobacteriota bacterium]|nr:aldehyde ferredoxin oxidoreductase N-terminal domain-containing protein [Thermodesulfobacteriota bacterium]
MKGFHNRILMIDLTSRSFETRDIPDSLCEKHLGGKGLASHLLLRFNPPRVDPFDAENCLIFATGPVTGSAVWGSCRYGLFTKSPQTGLYAESYAGGRVPEAVDSAGYDAILIKGKCDRLHILIISPDRVSFRDAENLRGLDTYKTEDSVRMRFGNTDKGWKIGAVVIGPAGENRVRFSVVENDHWRSAGRTGTGAIMGSKGIKAILFMGDRKRTFHDSEGVRSLSKQLPREARDNPTAQGYKAMGTAGMVRIVNEIGAFPSQYWSRGTAKNWEKLSAEALHKRCQVT